MSSNAPNNPAHVRLSEHLKALPRAAEPADELQRIREQLHCEAGGDPIAVIDMLKSWGADANRRADALASHLRWVIEIARTWQPLYATDMDVATIAQAEDALKGKPKVAQPADVARLVDEARATYASPESRLRAIVVLTEQRDRLLQALQLIEHATSPDHDDDGHHEAAWDLARAARAEIGGAA